MTSKSLGSHIGKTVCLIGEVVNHRDQSSIIVRASDGGDVMISTHQGQEIHT